MKRLNLSTDLVRMRTSLTKIRVLIRPVVSFKLTQKINLDQYFLEKREKCIPIMKSKRHLAFHDGYNKIKKPNLITISEKIWFQMKA